MTWRFYGICSTLLTLKWFTHKSAPICLNHFCLKMRKLLHLFQQRIVYLCFHIHKYDGNIFMLKFMLGMPKINEHPIHFGANHQSLRIPRDTTFLATIVRSCVPKFITHLHELSFCKRLRILPRLWLPYLLYSPCDNQQIATVILANHQDYIT